MIATDPFRVIAEQNIILRTEVGSRAHGIGLGGGDRDEMAVCLEPPEYVIGLARVPGPDGTPREFGQWVHRTAEERLGHDATADQRRHGRTPRSEAEDLDLTVYSLRKWARLAAAGNPTVLLLLFSTPLPLADERAAELGHVLQANADMFASRQAGERFLGYLRAQRERLLGERGQMRVTRTELVEAHGFDTKFAAHAVRLGYQGVEYLTTGRLTLPMAGTPRDHCMAVRRGEVPLSAVIELIDSLGSVLANMQAASLLPVRPDCDRISRFLVDTYEAWWTRG